MEGDKENLVEKVRSLVQELEPFWQQGLATSNLQSEGRPSFAVALFGS